jgi:hypothetical protein
MTPPFFISFTLEPTNTSGRSHSSQDNTLTGIVRITAMLPNVSKVPVKVFQGFNLVPP